VPGRLRPALGASATSAPGRGTLHVQPSQERLPRAHRLLEDQDDGPIPNLIEIQKKSYERFLQMNRLPSEREDAGLQSVFKSVFPISDFRENSSLEFIEYSIGNWECKCGKLAGLHHLRKPCKNCGHTLIADPYGDKDVLCPRAARPTRRAATSATSAATRSR
jgi:hypothetical protein